MIKIPKDFPWITVQEEIDGRFVNLLGVWHDSSYLPHVGKYLTQCIEQSDVLIMECNIPLLDHPKQIKKHVDFFKYFAKKAAENDKDVWSIDPIYQNYERESAITIGKIIGGGLLLGISRMKMIPERRYYSFQKVKKPSRRKMLGLLGLCGLGAGTFVNGLADSFYFSGIRSFIGMSAEQYQTFGTDDIITHDHCDYRNIKIAQGLDKLIEHSPEGSEIVMLAGDLHIRQSFHYLTHPILRQAKAQTYLENLVYDTSLRKYSFDNNDWVETERIKN